MTGLPVGRERVGPVATLTLRRPERHNSLVPELLRDLLAVLDHVAADDQARAVVLAAEGPSFSTGGDVREFARRDGEELVRYADEVVGLLNEAVLRLLRLDLPVVAAVHGPVTGGSLGLVLASDIVLVSPDASFAPWYTAVGYGPDGGWTALLPHRIGTARASAVQILNETVSASDAVAWGLAHRIEDDVRKAAHDAALRAAGQRAVVVTKRLLNADAHAHLHADGPSGIAARLDAERHAFVAQIATPEAREGMTAFLGGRA